jgi:hypothetical protein
MADKPVIELRRAVSELRHKCEDLAAHKRFLAHQIAEASAGLSDQQQPTQQPPPQQPEQQPPLQQQPQGEQDDDSGLECLICR